MENTLLIIIFCIPLSFIISYMLSRYLLKNADKFRIGKRVYSERIKLHRRGIPRLGGLAIYVSIYATLIIFYVFTIHQIQYKIARLAGIFLASTLLVAYGLYDDIVKRMGYKIKFILQIMACILVINFGYRVNVITNPFDGEIYIGALGVLFIIIWLIMTMNAINLMDGLDGLACGISIIVCFNFFIISLYQKNLFLFIMTTSAIGASAGFLMYNFYPAKLFLGDSGSIFLGFMLGIFAMESSTKRATAISLIIPLLTLFIPLASVMFTFSRRIAYAKNPFEPDKKHLHYRFIKAGVSHKDTVLIYYSVSLFYMILGIFCFFMPKRFEIGIMILAAVTMWILYMWAMHFLSAKKSRAAGKPSR
ncbi:MAG: undecaprenyl/decaprenyl-phosphate alpha-N-acetylglucosaminyl 1-phosphate transferase [Candidatus Omnitrophica bacterium]|nr:undecaprenyl/decaprenyl-phosphate alpha-N-acetylglucosaminyl 1-phosphate transferase [Candidatus Omnitrophota bacterium]